MATKPTVELRQLKIAKNREANARWLRKLFRCSNELRFLDEQYKRLIKPTPARELNGQPAALPVAEARAEARTEVKPDDPFDLPAWMKRKPDPAVAAVTAEITEREEKKKTGVRARRAAIKKQTAEHDAIPASKRRWDERKGRWILEA
jgi:hypothetical protein